MVEITTKMIEELKELSGIGDRVHLKMALMAADGDMDKALTILGVRKNSAGTSKGDANGMSEKSNNSQIDRCICCGTATEGRSFCPYCGFVQVVSMDTEGDKYNEKIKKEHRQEVIDALKNFSVVSYRYKWNAGASRLDLDTEERVKIADGKECDGNVRWAKETFGQSLAEDKPIKLTIHYTCDGKKKQVTCSLKPVQCNDFWKLGVMIDQNLRLVVCLGTEQNHVKSSPMNLALI